MSNKMGHIVSPGTFHKMVAAGWAKQAEDTDAQEIADQLKDVDWNLSNVVGKEDYYWSINAHRTGSYEPSLAEALATVWLWVQRANHG